MTFFSFAFSPTIRDRPPLSYTSTCFDYPLPLRTHQHSLNRIQSSTFWSSFSSFTFNVHVHNHFHCFFFQTISVYSHLSCPLSTLHQHYLFSVTRSFLILSPLVTTLIHLSILIPATLVLCSTLRIIQHRWSHYTPVKLTF